MNETVDRLPEDRLTRTIAGMREGESAWVTPWAMDVDADRRCTLRPGYSIHDQPGGTVCMRIERHQEGFHVWVPRNTTWTTGSGMDGLPVAELHFEWP